MICNCYTKTKVKKSAIKINVNRTVIKVGSLAGIITDKQGFTASLKLRPERYRQICRCDLTKGVWVVLRRIGVSVNSVDVSSVGHARVDGGQTWRACVTWHELLEEGDESSTQLDLVFVRLQRCFVLRPATQHLRNYLSTTARPVRNPSYEMTISKKRIKIEPQSTSLHWI